MRASDAAAVAEIDRDLPADDRVPGSPGTSRTAMGVVLVVAVVFALRAAQAVFVPIALGVIVSYALEPIVAGLARLRVPRAAAAGILLAALVGGMGAGLSALQDDGVAILSELPAAARKLRASLHARGADPGPVAKVQQLATEIEKSAAEAAGSAPPGRGVTRVELAEKPLDVRGALWTGSMGALGLASQAILLLFLVYFLLASGDLYKRKLVRIVGPSLSRKRVTVEVLDEVSDSIQRFLFVQLLTSAIVALISWLAFRSAGLEQAAVWGVAAGVLNSIPYFGPVVVMAGVALVGFFQFGTVAMAAYLAAVSFVITSLEGYLLTPWLVGRAVRMNQVAVFVGLLFWTWMWGVVGLLLAVPMLAIVKSVCDRVEDLKPIGELLGE
jgi:predicted PurR-regulated permease PerM